MVAGRTSLGVLFLLAAVPAFSQTAPDPLPHLDEQFGCFEASLVDRYVRDFNIDIRSFGGVELCKPDHDAHRIIADIYLVENGRFGPARLPANVFIRNFVPADRYYEWSRQQTRGMRRGNDLPYATAYNRGGFFTFQNGWAQSSTLGRVGTMIHEARHTQGYVHTRCVRGPYAGTSVSGCDTSLPQGGSHGVEMEYYARVVVQGQNFHPVYKSMARLMALGRSNAFFNDPAIQRREGLALRRTGNRGAYALYTSPPAPGANRGFRPRNINEGRLIERSAPAITNAVLKRGSFGTTLFTGESAFAIDLYSRAQGVAQLADAYSYFKLLFRDDASRLRIADVEEFDLGDTRYVVALTEDDRLLHYDFPAGEWSRRPEMVGFRRGRLTTTDPKGGAGLFVVAPDGQARRWNPLTQRLEAHAERWPAEYKDFVRFENRVLALGRNGTIYAVDGAQPVPFDALRGVAAQELVSVPLYDAFSIE